LLDQLADGPVNVALARLLVPDAVADRSLVIIAAAPEAERGSGQFEHICPQKFIATSPGHLFANLVGHDKALPLGAAGHLVRNLLNTRH